MTRLLTLAVVVGSGWVVGCGPSYGGKRPDLIDVTATVTGPDGKPLPATLAVILLPTGDTLMAKLTRQATGKEFAGKAMPGKYMYYIAQAKSEDPPKGVPEKYTTASEENRVEVAAGKNIEIVLTN